MYKRILKLYEEHRITIEGLVNAVKDHFITAVQFKEISGQDYNEYINVSTSKKTIEGETDE